MFIAKYQNEERKISTLNDAFVSIDFTSLSLCLLSMPFV